MELIHACTQSFFHKDGPLLLHTANRGVIHWEHEVLNRLSGMTGIPRLHAIMPVPGDPERLRLTLIRDYVKGVDLKSLQQHIPLPIDSLRPTLEAAAKAGIVLNIDPARVIMTPTGTLALIGFHRAKHGNTAPDIEKLINDYL